MLEAFKLSLPHEIYLMRHGETRWNREGRIQGGRDSELTSLGRDQALRQGAVLRRILPRLGPVAVFCSPLGRAQSTARLALGASDFTLDARIAEIGCGRWEGTTAAERQQSDPDVTFEAEFDLYTKAPEGEGLAALATRINAFLRDLEGPTVVVSHKVALTVLRALVCDDALRSDLAPKQGSIMRLRDGVAYSL